MQDIWHYGNAPWGLPLRAILGVRLWRCCALPRR